MEYISNSQEDTIKIAKNFAKTLSKGDVVVLKGDLGAGKTVFTKGIASYFHGDKNHTISPTFTILNEYNTNPKIYHFDFYRIKNEDELIAIGIEEYLFGDGICVIEWPERAPETLSMVKTKNVEIIKNGESRKIIF